jgi:hypothetical protein
VEAPWGTDACMVSPKCWSATYNSLDAPVRGNA